MNYTTLTIEGQPFSCVVHGERGPLLVLLHGFGEDHTIWEAFLPAFSRRCRVLAIDLPGFGRSPLTGDYDMEGLAKAVAAIVEAQGDRQCLLLGHSMGGYVALAFAQHVPGGLLGLGLVHSHPFADNEERQEGRRRSIDFIRRSGHEAYVRQLIPGLFSPAFAESHPDQINRLIQRGLSYPAEAYIAALQAMLGRPDRSEVLRQGNYPVLFVIGAEDTLIPQDRILDVTHLPETSVIHRWAGVGHMSLLEAPQLLQAAVLDFLEICAPSQNDRG